MHRGCFVWTPTPPLAGRRTPRPGPVRVCVCLLFLAGSGGPASRARSGAPHLFLWPLCLSALLGPLRAGVAPVLVLCFFFSVSPSFFLLAPALSLAFFDLRPRVPWALALCVVCFVGPALLGSPCALAFFVLPGHWPLSGGCPSPPFSLAAVAVPQCLALVFFFPLLCAPLVSGFLCFPAPRALGLGAGLCLLCSALRALCFSSFFSFFFFPAPRLSVLRALSPVLCLSVGRWLFPGGCCPPPPPLLCLAVFVLPARCLGFFFSLSFCAPPLSPAFSGFPPRVPWALALCFVCFSRPPAARLSVRSRLVGVSRLAVGFSLVVAAPPPPIPFCVSRFSSPLLGALVFFFFFFFFFLCAPPLFPAFSGFRPRVLCASALCVVCSVGLPLLGSLCALALFLLSAWPLAAPWWLLPPPPFVSRGFRRCRSLLCAVCCAVLCVPWCGAAPHCCALCRPVLCCRVLSCFVALARCRCLLRHALWRCPSPWGPVLCGAVFCGVPPRCVLRALCVLSWRGGACCCSPLCFVLSVSRGAVLCVPCPLRSVRCCASLCWRACVVLFVWCVLLLAPGAVVRCCVLCCFLWCAVVRCWSGGPWLSAGGVFWCRCPCLAAWSASLWLVWFAVVPCFPVSCSVVLCCRVVLCCCALLSCCGAVGACFALLWPVVLCCVVLLVGFAVFCPVGVSACCGALSLVLCVPCLLRSVRGGALLCWLWCPASLCRVLWRCAVVWCCAVVLCCHFAVPFVFALPSCGLSCGAVLCSVVLLVVCAVFCPVVAFVCCGALSLPAGTHKKYLTCHPALVAVSWPACLGGCGVLDLTPRTSHLQRKGGKSVEEGARAGGEGTW